MVTPEPPPLEDDRRGLLTSREREILTHEADVSENYRSTVVSRVRQKITKIGSDAALLREHRPDLYTNLRSEVCDGGQIDEE